MPTTMVLNASYYVCWQFIQHKLIKGILYKSHVGLPEFNEFSLGNLQSKNQGLDIMNEDPESEVQSIEEFC